MRDIVLGFLAGVAVTLATLAAVRVGPDDNLSRADNVERSRMEAQSSEQSLVESPLSGGREEPGLQASDLSESQDRQGTTDGAQDGASPASGTSVAAASTDTASVVDDPQVASRGAERAERVQAEDQASAATDDAFEVPVAPELTSAFLDPESDSYSATSAENHRELESLERDASWSGYMEAQIAAYLFANEELSRHFSIPSIDCRPTICEVQAIGYGPGAYSAWVDATAGAPNQPWFEFTGAGGPVRQVDGQTLILWYLTNENKQPQQARALPLGADT